MDLNAIKLLINHELAEANALILSSLDSEIPLIQQLGFYITQSGGKQIRPLLSILTAQAIGYQGQQHVKLAAIVELIHTSTLLHDDVVDGSQLRRGQATANAVFGNSASVLVGDFLYSQAFQLMASMEDLSVIKILAETTKKLAEGEVLQLTHSFNPQMTEEDYRKTIYAKTASLFEAVTQLGAILAKASHDEVIALQSYGRYLGVSFQMADDLLDYTASDEILGKEVGDDLSEGKMTLPVIYALSQASKEERQQIEEIIEHARLDALDILVELMHKTGALTYTKKKAEQEAQKAIDALQAIPESNAKSALISLARICISRNH